MTIQDKSFVFTRWYRSVWVMILVIAIAIFPNDYPIKWVLVCLLLPFFGLSREIFLNENANSIDRRFNFFGIKRMIERFPIEQTKSISVKQNPKNQYEFILEMESGLERILFVEDLKIDMDRHVALVEKFRAKAD